MVLDITHPGHSMEIMRLDRALRHALARHETALARLRHELPSPTTAVLHELEAAELELRNVQSQRDLILTR